MSFEETKTGGSSSSATLTTAADLTAVSGDLYLAAVSTRPNRGVNGLAGLGLSWTQVKAQCSGRNQIGVQVWRAQGTPTSSGPVSATLASAATNAVIAVSRYSGVAAANPIGNVVSGNTTGADGLALCSGGVDNNAYAFNLTTTANGARVYGAAAMRNRLHSPGAGYTERAEVDQGTSGVIASVATEDQSVATAAPVTVNGSFSGSVDWAVIGLEVKPQ